MMTSRKRESTKKRTTGKPRAEEVGRGKAKAKLRQKGY
jgi:hypothetical protein